MSDSQLGPNARRFVAEFNRDSLSQGERTSRPEPAKVTSTSPGSGKCTVQWRGEAHQSGYLTSYTPTVSDVVLVLVSPPAGLIILGKIA